jgi:hypothetical protein
MKPLRFLVVAALFVTALALAAAPASAQLLANGGFEQPVTTDGPPYVGSWEAFNGGPGSQAANSNNMPRSGVAHLQLSIAGVENTFAGVFQDVPNLTPGTLTTLSGYHMTTSNPLDAGAEIRIEWRNSTTNAEISRTPNLVPVLTGQYAPFTLSSVVPAGANTARVVYAIQSFGPGATNTGVINVDDVSFVPEPSSALLCVGGLGLAAMRRRRK